MPDFDPEFDQPFTVADDLTLSFPPGVYAPECYASDDSLSLDLCGYPWSPVSGYSRQDRYPGPVMHPSELFGGRMRSDTLETPGTYCLVVVSDPDSDDAPGWALVTLTEG